MRIASDLLPQIRTQRSMISYFGGREEHARGKLSEAEMIAALKQVEAGDVLVHLGIREILLRHMSPNPVSGQRPFQQATGPH